MTDFVLNIKWTNIVWIITIVTLIILFFAGYSIMKRSGINWWYFNFPILLIIGGVLVVTLLMAPLSLKFSATQLKICKIGGTTSISYNEIEKVGLVTFKSATRVFGSGGLFGYIGRFSNRELGVFMSYVGDPSHTFYLKTKNGKTYVLSCEHPEIAVEKLQEMIQ